jgi:hypothetical protein
MRIRMRDFTGVVVLALMLSFPAVDARAQSPAATELYVVALATAATMSTATALPEAFRGNSLYWRVLKSENAVNYQLCLGFFDTRGDAERARQQLATSFREARVFSVSSAERENLLKAQQGAGPAPVPAPPAESISPALLAPAEADLNVATTSVPPAPATRRWYVGVSLGDSTSDYSTSDARSNFGYTGVPFVEKVAAGGKVFGGFRFNPYAGLEVGYVNLGITKVSETFGGAASADELDAYGNYLAFVGNVPLGKGVSLLGRLGVGRITGVHTCKRNCSVGDFGSTTTMVPFLGYGVQFDIGNRFAIRLEQEDFGKVEFDSTGALNATYKLLTGSFLFKF